jgi:hypothetical protein
MTYTAGDDVTWTIPVFDSNGGQLDDNVAVRALDGPPSDPATTSVDVADADWDGPATSVEDDVTMRLLGVPLATIPAGLWALWLTRTGEDLFLGNVHIQ